MDSIDIRQFLIKTAEERGFRLQTNEDILKRSIEAMKKRQFAGRIVCPCKGFIDEYTTPESFCPCPESIMDVENKGCCHCNVFLKRD